MNLLPIIYFIVIFSSLNMSLQTVIQERNLLIEPDRVQHSLNQLALAQYRYYANEVSAGRSGSYAADFNALKVANLLPIWQLDPSPADPTRDRYSMDISSPGNLVLKYEVDNERDAGAIAARLGSVAMLADTDGDGDTDEVQVAYSSPIDASLMGIFLPRDASLPMTEGPLRTKDLIVEGELKVKGVGAADDDPILTVNSSGVAVTPATATLTVAGTSHLARLNAAGPATLNNTLTVRGQSWLLNTLTVRGASELQDTLTVAGVSRMNEWLYANNGFSVLSGHATLNASMDVVGPVRLLSPVLLDNDVTVTGVLQAEDGNHLVLGSDLIGEGSGDVVVGRDLKVWGSSRVLLDSDVGGDLNLYGNLINHGP